MTSLAQQQEAILQAEKDLTEKLNGEWAKKLVNEIDSAVEKADAVSKAKVSKQQEALEEFKRDMIVQTQRLADERNDLQRRFMNSSEVAERLQLERRSELNQMKIGRTSLKLDSLLFPKTCFLNLNEKTTYTCFVYQYLLPH